MKPGLKFELWSSNDNQTEIHFFDPNHQNSYILGVNPKLISLKTALTLLVDLGWEFPSGATKAWIEAHSR